jgi:hypothetical protein
VRGVEITFGDDVSFDADAKAEIDAVLRRISTDGGVGGWPEPVEHILVTGLLDEGYSDATVVQVVLYRGSQRLGRVVKTSGLESAAREWRAFRSLVEPYANFACARIEATTPGVLDAALSRDGEPEAVVYEHVAQTAGEPHRGVRAFGDLVSAACEGHAGALASVTSGIERFFVRAHQALYNRHKILSHSSSLRRWNHTLGPDLVLEVDRIDESGRLQSGMPHEHDFRAAIRLPDQVLENSLADPGSEGIEVGHRIALQLFAPRRKPPGLLVQRDHVSAQVSVAHGSERYVSLDKLVNRTELDVYGVVTAVRPQTRWKALDDAFTQLTRDDRAIIADGTRTADPFLGLRFALTHPDLGRVPSVAHGDLNPRNLLFVSDQPFMIDYAKTAEDQPILIDFARLEVSLLLSEFAQLGHRGLVHMQRQLALASVLLDQTDEAGHRLENMAKTLYPDEVRADAGFHIMLAIRRQAKLCFPPEAPLTWRDHYFAQLLLAAHRTLKYRGPHQSPEQMRAATAVASVATEWIPNSDPFRHWMAKEASEALAALDFAPTTTGNSTEVIRRLVAPLLTKRNRAQGSDLPDGLIRGARSPFTAARLVNNGVPPSVPASVPDTGSPERRQSPSVADTQVSTTLGEIPTPDRPATGGRGDENPAGHSPSDPLAPSVPGTEDEGPVDGGSSGTRSRPGPKNPHVSRRGLLLAGAAGTIGFGGVALARDLVFSPDGPDPRRTPPIRISATNRWYPDDDYLYALGAPVSQEQDQRIMTAVHPDNWAWLTVEAPGVRLIDTPARGGPQGSRFDVSVQGAWSETVLITDIKARVLRRFGPLSGSLAVARAGGEVTVASIGFDLDAADTSARVLDRNDYQLAERYTDLKKITLAHGEIVPLQVVALTSRYYCEWQIEFTVEVDGTKVPVSTEERSPLKTTAFSTRYVTVYEYDIQTSKVRRIPGEQWRWNG